MNAKLGEIVGKRREMLKKKPEMAMYTAKVSSTLVSGLMTEGRVREHTVVSDYAVPAGGTNKGPNPIELLLASFAACVEAAFNEFAEYRGLKIESLSVDIEGTLDLRGLFMIDDVKSRFKDVRFTFNIETPDDKDEVLALAREVIAHCPVVDSLANGVPINGSVSINGNTSPAGISAD